MARIQGRKEKGEEKVARKSERSQTDMAKVVGKEGRVIDRVL